MEELKLLLEMVAKLPNLAIWVIVAIYAYKTIIVGSIYATIRFVIQKWHDAYVTNKTKKETKDAEYLLRELVIKDELAMAALINEIRRIRSCGDKNSSYKSQFVHRSDIDWLASAIDDKISKDYHKKEK